MRKKVLSLVLLLLAGITAAHAYDFSAVAPTGQTLYYTVLDPVTHTVVVTNPNNTASSTAWNGYTQPTGSLTIPSSVTYYENTYSVTTISIYAFYGCTGLTSVSIPNSVTSIGNYAFQNCTGLTSISIPNSVTTIGNSAFYGCTGLTSISIPNSVTTIGNSAFYGCTGLTSVSIPNSVTSIGSYTFAYCSGLTSVSIPNSVTYINIYAFYNCTSLTSISIPSSVTYIYNYAFYNCNGLTSITVKRASPPSIYSNTFNAPTNIPVYIPCGSTATYASTSSYWSRFRIFIEESDVHISVSSSNTTMGTARVVTQPSCTSSTATVSATPRSGYTFLNWTVGNTVVSTSQTYSFTATASRTLKANFAYAGNCDITNSNLPYSNNFDSYTTSTTAKTGVQPPCWTLAHQDVSMTDAYKPMIYYDNSIAHSGNYSLILNKRCIYAMPYVTMDVNRLKLTFYLRQTQTKYQLQVGVMSDLSDESTFVPVATLDNSSTTASVFQTVNFDTYTGLGHYIAFRNILAPGNTGDYSCNYIDDLTLSVNTAACTLQVSSLPYTDNFNSYTTSTTAKTCVEPPCWTLAHQDVTMTDEYKPMIYYSSANAHSGNYSLILNKRGIYAMPYINGSVSNLQLSMYVKQPQTKYQMQVGIMNDLNNASTFTPIATINNSGTGYVLHTISFSSYTGSGRYIAFRNILASGQTGDYSLNYIDDLTLSNTSTYTITATANPTAGGTVTGGGTYNSGATCTLRATAASGYAFTNWTSGSTVVSTNATYSFTVSANRTLKANFVRRYTITASANPSTGGTVTGGGTYNNGATCTLRATPNANYTFTNWTTGSTVLSTNPTYSFTVSANKTIKANFAYTANCGIDNSDLPYTDNFDSYTTSTTSKTGYTLPCWTLAHQDVTITDEYKPMVYYGNSYSGNYSLILNKRCIYAMPRVAMDVNLLKLQFYVKQTAAKYQLQVGVMTDLNDASTFTPVATINNSSTTESVLRTVTFSNYTGLGHYIAFRNILASGNTGDYSLNYIDNLTLSVNTSACSLYVSNLPFSDNFDSYTTSTTAKTGVEPPCWNLAHQDVTMTDEYKPMVYYSSANAHSGNYSLILNKRGIYTMPYIDGSIRNLQLSMYVKQTQTKYQLQVGVMSDLNDASSFTPIATIYNSGTGYVLHTVSFSSYTGSGRYIAFRNTLASGNTGDFSCNYIDDLTLSNAATYTITATANPTAGGSVSGAGSYTSGSTCTLRATPASGYTFTNWTSGSTVVSTNATYSFTVTANRTLKANFTYTPNCQIQPSSLPYFDNFNSYTSSTTAKTGVEPACWTLAYQDVTMTNEYKPMIYYSSANAHSGNYSLILNKRGIYAMPQYTGDVSTLQVSFYLKQTKSTYGLTVGVMSSLSNPSSFVPVATLYNSSTSAIEHHVVDFSSYTGNGHYIAFRNINSAVSDFSCNFIDDLTLSLSTSSCVIHAADMPYSDNFDSYTNSTTAKTGVEPACWTLAYQDVSMTDEYKPMIYYSSTNAHSGSYSLILNKRGIYAMPRVDCDVNTLQLSMYVKQSQSKYQLQVGVMTDINNASSFVPVTTVNNGSTSSEHVTVSFARYTGNGRYIAFRNVLASGYSGEYSCNYIDDLTLSVRCAIHNSELPWIEGFENHTTSTTAKTGVEPACWTLVHQDVSMTTEYKPMVYYEASCAHSGNYSLILNKRCLYALPTVIANVNTLQMEIYVRQTQTKYQLQVGVLSDISNYNTFVPVATLDNGSNTTTSQRHVVNFSSYTGNGHYIAFRNILAPGNSGDYSCNYIDDITLRQPSAAYLEDDKSGSTHLDTPSQHRLTLYPNPTSDKLTVEADEEVVRVDVFDYTGRCVASFERQTTVDLGRLATGLYTLRVTLPERIEVRRVVKQ